MSLTIERSNRFKKDFKLILKRGYEINELVKVIEMLSDSVILPEKYKDHLLIGTGYNTRECHIQPDWLLIYLVDEEEQVITLVNTGSHSDLF